ncbi:ribonucleases P/MRP protein subunit POP1 [Carex littledalei]|uniref:Ribonucleases P/MRP protein subunit POP1 n=1 Tax=Carex littledalei TaxID=544730 RepID=A0A833RK48_9POAL|nr:ribonucleases P/MRP protein subunit POP1 [Carex littledalei]
MAATAQNPPPPRTLNVQRLADARRPEIQSLHSLVSSRLSASFRLPRSLRRRTTSHLRRSKRSRSSASRDSPPSDASDDDADQNREKKKVCRRERRRRELTSNPELGFVVAGDGTKRLRTHVWHAKRFQMVKRWGFYLPLGIQGRGRGSRAVLKLLQNGTLIHDASYYLPIQLEGPQDCLVSVLKMVLIPSPPGISEMPSVQLSHKVLQGACYQDAMLYHMDSSASRLIAPVKYMWHHMRSEIVECKNSSNNESGILSVWKLWIWVHAAAFHEGYNALRAACEKQQLHANGATVSCVSQEGRIARLDIMGAKASQLMNKILCPVTISDKACLTSEAQKQFNMDQIEKLPPGAILTLRVKDPRLLSSDLNLEFDEVPVNLDSLDSCKLYDNTELWDSHCKMDPPVLESILCTEKNKKRLNTLFLKPTNQEMLAGQQKDGSSRSCTVILLRHSLGWSIILPLSWVKPFWLSMVSNGAHVIGLRERRWVAWKNKVPCFPYDFPDSEAYKSLLADQGALFDASAQLRPHNRQPLKTPMPPPWDCVVASSHHICKNTIHCKAPNLDVYVPRTTEALKDCVGKMDTGDKGFVCLVRVLISAFKEGLFEDSAVVCAPCTDDLSGWNNTRLAEEVEEYQEKWQLQLTQSAVESYFMQLESDRWALQVPEDPVDLKSFRWPIGFVTTGAVHACNDRVAMAFCDIRILAALRRQQYLQTETKQPEIFVLVRNMKSTAYRRAIATIVLEQQQEDLHFL